MNNQTKLSFLSPLDGRYSTQTSQLREYFSEAALTKYRILIEVLYLVYLIEFLDKAKLTQAQKQKIINWAKNLGLNDFEKVKKIEAETHHDVKAVEYYIRDSLKRFHLDQLSPWIHWGLTSEDVNNLAYGLMVQKAKNEVLIPCNLDLIKYLLQMADNYTNVTMPARTHGQLAVPTTVGKELVVFVSRAQFFLEKIILLKLGGKLNGAVGNYNAYVRIFPKKNWLKFSKDFIQKLGLEPTIITTQVEPATRLVYLFDLLRQLNNIWLDLACDCWQYISFDYFSQKVTKKQVGSSTMPHKINPIDFENAEGNLQLANSLLAMLANKLPISRMQRDLSDSTVKRNIGVAFGYSLLALKSLIKGLGKIEVNYAVLKKEINNNPQMQSEALQLILKVWGKEYFEEIKQQTRGKKTSWKKLISKLDKKQQNSLHKWKVADYKGLAALLTKNEINRITKALNLKKEAV